jgi:GNAT superfamily N-acetyltransferase
MLQRECIRRDYVGPGDLPTLIRFLQRTWSPDNRWHIGDLAWDLGLSADDDGRQRMSLWERDGAVVAWGWLAMPRTPAGSPDLRLIVDRELPVIVDDVIDWAHERAGAPTTVTVVDTESWLVAPLERRGFTADLDGHFFASMACDLADLAPVPAPPAGFTVRPIRGDDEVPARAALDREVWSSDLTGEQYRALTQRWPYDARFDFVAEAPDGRLVSYILGWFDDVNRVGQFEPVGTLAEFRRMGLSRAVGIALMHAFREAGAVRAIVYGRGDDDYPVPRRAYKAMGFTSHGRTVIYRPSGS